MNVQRPLHLKYHDEVRLSKAPTPQLFVQISVVGILDSFSEAFLNIVYINIRIILY